MRALKLKQAGWISLGAFLISGWAIAGPALPPPVGQQVYTPHPGTMPPGVTPAGTAPGALDLDSSFDNLDVVDPDLKGKLAVLRVGSEVGENHLLSIFAGFKNKTAHHLDLEVQTIYKDKDGNALNSGSWIAFSLDAHEEKEYHSTSISEAAVDFLVRVRRASSSGSTH